MLPPRLSGKLLLLRSTEPLAHAKAALHMRSLRATSDLRKQRIGCKVVWCLEEARAFGFVASECGAQ